MIKLVLIKYVHVTVDGYQVREEISRLELEADAVTFTLKKAMFFRLEPSKSIKGDDDRVGLSINGSPLIPTVLTAKEVQESDFWLKVVADNKVVAECEVSI